MQNAQNHEAFVSFMQEYTDFLGQMRADENDKLKALTTRELSLIEQSIARSQANAKQLENFENKRSALQAGAGYQGLTFRQLIAQAPDREQGSLWQLFSRFENTVAEIRFFNDKSMAVARGNMMEINPAAVLPAHPGAAPARNPYERIRKQQKEQNGVLQAKA